MKSYTNTSGIDCSACHLGIYIDSFLLSLLQNLHTSTWMFACEMLTDIVFTVESELTWAVLVQRGWGSVRSMAQCVGHKKSNVPQREGLSVTQRHAAVAPGSHPCPHTLLVLPLSPKHCKLLNYFQRGIHLLMQCNVIYHYIHSCSVYTPTLHAACCSCSC